jgi:hypothetical protein
VATVEPAARERRVLSKLWLGEATTSSLSGARLARRRPIMEASALASEPCLHVGASDHARQSAVRAGDDCGAQLAAAQALGQGPVGRRAGLQTNVTAIDRLAAGRNGYRTADVR